MARRAITERSKRARFLQNSDHLLAFHTWENRAGSPLWNLHPSRWSKRVLIGTRVPTKTGVPSKISGSACTTPDKSTDCICSRPFRNSPFKIPNVNIESAFAFCNAGAQIDSVFRSRGWVPFATPEQKKAQPPNQGVTPLIMVEAAGVEPASENGLKEIPTCVVSLLISPPQTPTDKIPEGPVQKDSPITLERRQSAILHLNDTSVRGAGTTTH